MKRKGNHNFKPLKGRLNLTQLKFTNKQISKNIIKDLQKENIKKVIFEKEIFKEILLIKEGAAKL